MYQKFKKQENRKKKQQEKKWDLIQIMKDKDDKNKIISNSKEEIIGAKERMDFNENLIRGIETKEKYNQEMNIK